VVSLLERPAEGSTLPEPQADKSQSTDKHTDHLVRVDYRSNRLLSSRISIYLSHYIHRVCAVLDKMQVKSFHLSQTRTIPNSRLPLLVYLGAFPETSTPHQIEAKFQLNGWIPQVSIPRVFALTPLFPPILSLHTSPSKAHSSLCYRYSRNFTNC